MSLSLDVLKYCIIMLIGAYLGARFSPEPEQTAIIQQIQASKCKATITKRQNADGSHDEITEFLSESKQTQEVQSKKISHKNGLGLFKDEAFYSRKLLETDSLDLGAMIKQGKNETKLGIIINF